jgi:arsenate reductase
MTIGIYGIKTCDTMQKAFAWLKDHGVAYDFHDYKASGIDAARLRHWAGLVGWEKLLNRAGTTFKALPDADKENITEAKALKLMQAQPSMIKRPVWEVDGKVFTGFKPNSPERAVLETMLREQA